MLATLFAINLFAYADRTVVGAVAQAMKVDLRISDTEIGLLNGFAFALFYSVLGLPIARLAERSSRVNIVAIAVGVWSIFASLCGVARSFGELFLFRVGVGVGEAGFNPPVASLIADYYKAGRRAKAMAVVGLGGAFGPALGAMGGGMIAQAGSWRSAFIIIGLPGLILAPIAWFMLREPPRGWADGAQADAVARPGIIETFGYLLAKPAFRAVLVAGAIASAATNVISQFTASFFVRSFALSYAQAGFLAGMIGGVAVTLGVMMGGILSDRLAMRDRRWLMWTPGIGVLLSAPVYIMAVSTGSLWAAVAGFLIAGVGLFSYYSPTMASVQDMAAPRMRASASFLYSFATILIGAGLGPVISGALSDHFASGAFAGDFDASCPGGQAIKGAAEALVQSCRTASAAGLAHSLMAMQAAIPVGVIAYFVAARTLRRDTFVPAGEA